MSYKVTCYYSDTAIENTQIYTNNGVLVQTLEHKGELDDDGYQIAYVASFSGDTSFKAKAADGYVFSHWEYRVGGLGSTLQTDEANPFTYTKKENVWIKAVAYKSGGGVDDPVDSITARSQYSSTTIFLDVIGNPLIENYTYYIEDKAGTTYPASVSKGYSSDTRTLVLRVRDVDLQWDQWNYFTVKYSDDIEFERPVSVYAINNINAQITDLHLVSRLNGQWVLGWTKPDKRVASFKYDYVPGYKITTPEETIENTCNVTAYGLSVTAYIDAEPIDDNGVSYSVYAARSNTISFVSAPPRPTIEVTVSDNTINGTWGLVNKLYNNTYLSKFYVYINLYQKGSSEPISQYESVGAISGEFQFQGVPSGKYEIRASSVIYPGTGEAVWSVIDSGDHGEVNNGNYKYILVQDISVANTTAIAPWSWDTSNGVASDTQTQDSYNAINKVEGYNINDFSYLVWNDLVDKVHKVATLDGGGWLAAKTDGSVTYLSYDQTKMTPEDKTLTAKRFNTLKFNIGAPTNSPDTGIENDVNKGDPVYGWYFTNLTSALNTWIENISG